MYERKIQKDIRCPLEAFLEIFGGKWNFRIVSILATKKTLRYTELKRLTGPITDAVFASALKSLIANKIISRKSYNEIPPRVEYTLTEKGISVIPIFHNICQWTDSYIGDKKPDKGISLEQCKACEYLHKRQ